MTVVKVTILVCYIIYVFHDAKAYPHSKEQCADKYGDVVFLLDSSDSIHEEDFPKQLQLVQHVIKRFQVKKDGVHVSVATFASHVHTHFYLQDYYTTDSVIRAVSEIKYSNGATRTNVALKFVRENILDDSRGGRADVTKLIIVVTDGLSMDTNSTLLEASISRSLGIKILSVGVGIGPDDFELRNMASEYDGRKLMFKVDDFNSFREIEEELTETICKVMSFGEELADDPEAIDESATEKDILQECRGKAADVYFTIDSSSSLSSTNFKELVEFIIGSLDNFAVGPNATRVGVVQFSDDIKPEIKLEEDLSKEDLKRRLYNLKQLNGKTHTGEVLQFLREHGFKSRNTREEVPRVIVLLTDGQSSDPGLALHESKLLKEMGIYLFAVGIGDQIDYTELKNIASDQKEKFVLRVDDFDALSTFKKVLASNICHGLQDRNKTEESMVADATRKSSCQPPFSLSILYVYDCQSFHIGMAKVLEHFVFELMKEMSAHKSKSGIIANPCKGMKTSLSSSYNVESSTGHMKNSQMENVTALLRKARIKLFSNNFKTTIKTFLGSSAEEQTQGVYDKVVVLFVDEHATNEIHREAERLKFRSQVKLIVVYIGKNPADWVQTLASKPYQENTIIVSSVLYLQYTKESLLQNVCES